MPDLTTSTVIDTLMQASTEAAARDAVGLGAADAAQLGKIGVGAPANDSGTDSTVLVFLKRADSKGAGVSATQHVELACSPANSEVIVSLLGDVINTGSASGGAGHLIGLIGRATDTASGAMELWGVEGRLQARGTAGTHAAVNGLAEFAGASFVGREIHGVRARCDILELDLSTPLAQGRPVAFYAQAPRGGAPAEIFSFISEAGQLLNLGPIRARNSANTAEASLDHDGADSNIRSTGGNMRIRPGAGAYLILQEGAGFVPQEDGKPFGIDGFRWSGNFTQIKVGSGVITEGSGVPLWNGAAWPGGAGGSTHLAHVEVMDSGWPNFTGGWVATNNNGESQKVVFTSEITDASSAWNTTNNEYTAPETGLYLFLITATMVSDTNNNRNGAFILRKNGSDLANTDFSIVTRQDDNGRGRGACITVLTACAAGDILSLMYSVYQSSTRLSVRMQIAKV